MAILVAIGLHNRHLAVFVHREEVMAARGRLDGIGRDPDIAVGAVLEADGCTDARSQLPMDLAFGGTRADRAP